MAKRNELLLIRAARAGQAAAQLSLGKRYLFGSEGLPKNLPTALYWLDRAAHQDEKDAWLLIGSHVPFEIAQQTVQPGKLCVWYERAFDAGVAQAGLVLAKLVLGQAPGAVDQAMRSKALRALQAAAHAGIAEAQWLLAQTIGRPEALASFKPASTPPRIDNAAMREWATRAARSGVVEARYALADHAWASGDCDAFLRWALPLARECVARASAEQLSARDADLAARCTHAMLFTGTGDADEALRLRERAAQAGDRYAQFSLGIWFARIDPAGRRVATPGVANYKKAIRWLLLAGEQGVADAWYALSKIYLKPECSQRNLADAQRYLENAAQDGHGPAQLELGMSAWRMRRERQDNDVRAVYWLQKAMAQGVPEAAALLDRIASPAVPASWAQPVLQRLPREAVDSYPLLVARVELAARFGLSRMEALLIDPKAADRGHCLAIDVHPQKAHRRRRLILLRTADERRELDRIVRLFEQVDCGLAGPEGNYRQRLYRLKTLAVD